MGCEEGRHHLSLHLLVEEVNAGIDEKGERREEMVDELGSGGVPDVGVQAALEL